MTSKDQFSLRSTDHPNSRHLILVLGLAAAIGIAVAAAGSFTPPERMFSGSITVASLIAITVVSTRLRWLPMLLYWVELSVFDEAQLHFFRIQLGEIPFSAEDFGALILLIGCLISFASLRQSSPRQLGWTVGLLAILGWAIFCALVGSLRGNSLYSILIDFRTIAYLLLGYVAGRLTVQIPRDSNVIRAALWVALGGFVMQQTLSSIHEFSQPRGLSGQPDIYREITVPFATGVFGILTAMTFLQSPSNAKRWFGGAATAIGLGAIGATFIRAAWLATSAGVIAFASLLGPRGVARLAKPLVAFTLLAVMLTAAVPQVDIVVQSAVQRAVDAVIPVNSPGFVNTVDLRIQESRTALAYLSNPLDWFIGAGLGLIVSMQNPFQHDSLIWLISKEGLIGTVLFIWTVLFVPLATGLRARHRLDAADRLLLSVLMGGLFAGAVGGVGSGIMTYAPLMPLFGSAVAWIEQISRRTSSRDSCDLDKPRLVGEDSSVSHPALPRPAA